MKAWAVLARPVPLVAVQVPPLEASRHAAQTLRRWLRPSLGS